MNVVIVPACVRPYKLYVHMRGDASQCYLYGEYRTMARLVSQMEALLKLGRMITVVVGENRFTQTHLF